MISNFRFSNKEAAGQILFKQPELYVFLSNDQRIIMITISVIILMMNKFVCGSL